MTTTTAPAVYTIGLIRDQAIAYTGPDGQLEELSPLYESVYGSQEELVWSASFGDVIIVLLMPYIYLRSKLC